MFKVCVYVLLFIIRLRFPTSESLVHVVNRRYGRGTVQLLRKLEKLDYKHRKAKLDLEFLLSCQEKEVIPNFLYFKLANKRLQTSEAYRNFQNRLLSEEINEKKRRIEQTSKSINLTGNELRRTLNWVDYVHISTKFLLQNDKGLKLRENVQNDKLNKLLFTEPLEKHDPDKIIFNFSSQNLSEDEKKLLCKGLNFALPSNGMSYGDFMLPFELFYRDIKALAPSPDDLLHVKSKLTNVAFSSFNSFKRVAKYEKNLSDDELVALNHLMSNKDIVVQKADKGNTVVITDKTVYTEAVKGILDDETKFKKLGIQCTNEKELLKCILDQERHVRDTLYQYCGDNKKRIADYFTKRQYYDLCPRGTRPGILYGSPKVHKPVVNNKPKFRPILSTINTSTYKLSKYIVPLLAPITTNEYTVTNSFAFAKEACNFDSSLHMSSLDVDSLFTNIPLEETIDICVDNLYAEDGPNNGIDKHAFRKLLTTALMDNCFMFDGELYKQIDGVAMGSPLGPHLANAFLSHHEKIWLSNCPENIKPLVYRRYVDDIFILCRDVEHHNEFLDYMNKQHPNMSFSAETESENQLAFLDVLVFREPSKSTFSTNVYRKTTFSGVYTNFKSFIPLKYKIGLLWTLLDRCFNLVSDYKLLDDQIKKTKSIFRKNSYPMEFIDQCVNSFLLKKFLPPVSLAKKKDITVVLPYLGKLSLQMARKIQWVTSKHLKKYCNLRVIFKTPRRLSNCFTFKDSIPNSLRSYIVYKYTCKSCNEIYIGKTDRHHYVRNCEHFGRTPIKGCNTKRKLNPSRVRDHLLASNHDSCMTSDFSILDGVQSTNDFHLRIKESLYIHRDKPALNAQDSSTPLELFT